MTSVQASGPRIAVPFHIMPPAPSSCRYHEGYRSAANPPPPLMPISYCNSYGSCTAIPTQCAHCPSGTTFESMEKIVPPSDSALSLQTDPEMYALRNVMSTHAAKLVDSAEYRHYSYPSLQTIPPMALKRNDRLAYVEALVDTNAHVIETIWSPTASRYVKSAVVPLRMFIQEVLKRSRTTYSTLQTALFYLFRARPALLAQLYGTGADRKQEQWQDAYINCGRRMFLASLVVASKFVQDKTYRNSAWAKIAGLPVAEINAAERIFLELIDYRLYIAQSTFEQWHHLLHMHVEARARSEPVSYLQDLSYLPIGMQLPPPPPPPPTHLQQPSLPSPTSPQHTEHIASTNTHCSGSPCNILHCLPDPYGYMSHHAHTGRKRRLRETSWTDEKQHSTVFNPISPVSPNYANVATAVSPTHSGSVPPMLSLSLPSSISSSPMHTPTQVSPMRMNIGNWKTGTSPTIKHAVAAHCDLQHNLVLKKRRIADNEYPSHQGYAVSHVRGLSKRRQQRKDRQ